MEISEKQFNRPLFTIGIVADIIGVTQTTLRIWEKKGLIIPQRLGKNRYYSYCDLDRLKEIRHFLQVKKMNIAGVRNVLERERCWEIKNCGSLKDDCPVYLEQEKR